MNIFMWYSSEMFMRLMNCKENIAQKVLVREATRCESVDTDRTTYAHTHNVKQAELSRSSFQLHCHKPVPTQSSRITECV
jgi:hypothetical protein